MALHKQHLHLSLLTLIWAVGLLVTGWQPYDRGTWLLEVLPAIVALPILWWARIRFPLTPLVYYAVCLHGLVLMLGGMYTYARVPLGFEMQEWLGLDRNPYDKVGHFFQGFVPALVAREILVRGNFVRGAGMLRFVVVSIVMFISSFYELVEWWTALLLGQGAVEFLGTQGYVWDTQSDMFYALIGAICALLTMTAWQDKQIGQLGTH